MVSVVPAVDEFSSRMQTREASPAHFLIKIESVSLLAKCGIDKYETKEFKAGGEYKWKLIIYPNGDDTVGEDGDYVSVNLAMADTSSLPGNWEVNVVFNIFIFNQNSGNYLFSGITRRFQLMKSEWGFSKFISKEIMSNPSNGYLVKDNCVFGAEVFVVKSEAVTESLSLKNVDIPYKQEFMISKFSQVEHIWKSQEFSVGGHKWRIWVYPKGDAQGTGRDVSVYLSNVTPEISERVKARFTIRVKNQVSDQHKCRTSTNWFRATTPAFGWRSFTAIATINDPKNGFIVKDSCLVSIELSVQAVAKGSPASI